MNTQLRDALYETQLALSLRDYRALQRAMKSLRSLGFIRVNVKLNQRYQVIAAEAQRILMSYRRSGWDGQRSQQRTQETWDFNSQPQPTSEFSRMVTAYRRNFLAYRANHGYQATKAKYRELCRRWHPDVNPGVSDERFKALSNAWEAIAA